MKRNVFLDGLLGSRQLLHHEPGIKLTTPAGIPASSSTSINLYAITGVVEAGFNKTVFPVTIAATVVPAIIANAKFHGEITTPTPNGM